MPVMKTIEINGVTEQIIERSDYPIERQRAILGEEVTAVLGYGPQGRGQSLNLRDQGFSVLIGVRPGRSMDRALEDGWEEGENLLSIEDAAETTFEHEVYSDLTGERSVLMGLIQGAFKAQYEVLRSHGHSPSEAYNETVEEALQSLYPLIGENGMDWMYANCSTTAQRGALDWAPRFESALKPLIEECYESVVRGDEARTVIRANSDPNYRSRLEQELRGMAAQELWQAGRVLRDFRPERHQAST